jgi:hypothetical protein
MPIGRSVGGLILPRKRNDALYVRLGMAVRAELGQNPE